jgi:hypothetical protein
MAQLRRTLRLRVDLLSLLVSPRRAYSTLRTQPQQYDGPYVLRYPLLISLVLGTSVALAATASVDIPLVLSAALSWSVAPIVQMVGATLLVLSVRDRPVTVTRGIDLMLKGHVPWSLWLLAMGACLALGAGRDTFWPLAGVALIAVMIWRAFLVYCFLHDGLGCTRLASASRTALHQLAMWTVLVAFIAWAIGLPARVS